MVNVTLPTYAPGGGGMTPEPVISDPELALSLSYAPGSTRSGLAAMVALDATLGKLLRTTRDPALGQIRLAWWRERLEALDMLPPPAEPVLQGLAAHVLPAGVRGAELVAIVTGWEVLMEEEALSVEALERYSAGRGQMFVLGGRVLRTTVKDPLVPAGQGWALADLARNLEDAGEAEMARALAKPLLHDATSRRWSRNARALGAMAHLAWRDLAVPHGQPPLTGSPGRVARMLWHRITGR
jgi:phytoene synthase